MTYFQIIFYSNSKESYFAKTALLFIFWDSENLQYLISIQLSVIYMSPTKQSTQLVCQL